MTRFLTRKVPAWTLAVAAIVVFFSLSTAWLQARESAALTQYIRMQEDRVPGFLEHTSVLSDAARCRRSLFIRFKDRLSGSDSCATTY